MIMIVSALKWNQINFMHSRHCLIQGSHTDWKTWKNGETFSSQGKVRNFVQTGKVREIWTKYWKSQENLENFYFLLFLIELFELLNCLIKLLTSYTIWVGWP